MAPKPPYNRPPVQSSVLGGGEASVSTRTYEAIVKLMEKSQGVHHFTPVKFPSLQKLLTLYCFIFPGYKLSGKKGAFLETNRKRR